MKNIDNYFKGKAHKIDKPYMPKFGDSGPMRSTEEERKQRAKEIVSNPKYNDLRNRLKFKGKKGSEDNTQLNTSPNTPPNAKAMRKAYLPTNEASVFRSNLGFNTKISIGLIGVLAGFFYLSY